MIADRWGRIVNITGKERASRKASTARSAPRPPCIRGRRGCRAKSGKHGITVNCVPPGRILSDQILRNYTPEYRQWQSEHEIPVGEYGQPEDVANLVCFLASPRARYITGAVIRRRRPSSLHQSL